MSVVGGLAVAGVVLGLGRTIAAQPRLRQWRDQILNNAGLFPQWKFYGPDPIGLDIHIVVRDRMEDGRPHAWHALLSPDVRSPWAFLWCPGKQLAATWDWYCDLILGPHLRADSPVEGYSIGYLAILRHCMTAHPRTPGASRRQFAIVHSFGREDRTLEMAFISVEHPW
ncbi:MAG: hypothetical protein WDN03_16340 [Rhizomicrobium sp.]